MDALINYLCCQVDLSVPYHKDDVSENLEVLEVPCDLCHQDTHLVLEGQEYLCLEKTNKYK